MPRALLLRGSCCESRGHVSSRRSTVGGLYVRVSFLKKLPPAFLSGCGVSLSLPTIAQDPSPESSPARGAPSTRHVPCPLLCSRPRFGRGRLPCRGSGPGGQHRLSGPGDVGVASLTRHCGAGWSWGFSGFMAGRAVLLGPPLPWPLPALPVCDALVFLQGLIRKPRGAGRQVVVGWQAARRVCLRLERALGSLLSRKNRWRVGS